MVSVAKPTGSGELAHASNMYGTELVRGYAREHELEADGLVVVGMAAGVLISLVVHFVGLPLLMALLQLLDLLQPPLLGRQRGELLLALREPMHSRGGAPAQHSSLPHWRTEM